MADDDDEEYGEWADPNLMNATYALLYNTLEINGRPFLRTQMAEAAWQTVYAPSVRSRRLCWTAATHAQLLYKPRRALPAGRVVAMPGVVRVVRVEAAQRSFSSQYSDGYLCGMHSFNNVANSVVLTPADALSAIETHRDLSDPLLAPEDLLMAALREGVFLLPLKLSTVTDLNPFDATVQFPRDKCLLRLLEKARGMVVYEQYAQTDSTGHFVSLVDNGDRVASDQRWHVFSVQSVVARGATAAAALDRYMLDRINAGLPIDNTKSREERRLELEERLAAAFHAAQEAKRERAFKAAKTDEQRARARNIGGTFLLNIFVGMLPLSLRLLCKDAAEPLVAGEMLFDDYIELVMTRTLVRRALSLLFSDANEPERMHYVAPSAVEELCWMITQSTSVDDDDRIDGAVFDGTERTNPASFILARHALDSELLTHAEQLARFLMRERRAGWTSDVVEEPGRREVTARERHEELRSALRQLRNAFTESSVGLGLFFNDSASSHDDAAFAKYTWLLSNRRWLRYATLAVIAEPLVAAIEAAIAQSRFPLAPAMRRLLTLYCIVAYRRLVSFGVKLTSMPNMQALLMTVGVVANRSAMLPFDTLPPSIDDVVRNQPNTADGPFIKQLLDANYQWCIWLLEAARATLGDAFAMPPLAPLLIGVGGGTDYDDMSIAYDEQRPRFIMLLRRTVFRMPMPTADFSLLAGLFGPQEADAPTRAAIAEHFRDGAFAFVQAAVAENFCADVAEALRWLDVFAYDSRYALSDWRDAAADITTHDVSDDFARPRFAERAALAGYAQIQLEVFGKNSLADRDLRVPITNNPTRIPAPSVRGQWRSTRPTVGQQQQLCVLRMSAMQPYVRASARSTRAPPAAQPPTVRAPPAAALPSPAAKAESKRPLVAMTTDVQQVLARIEALEQSLASIEEALEDKPGNALYTLRRDQTLALIAAANKKLANLLDEPETKRSRAAPRQ